MPKAKCDQLIGVRLELQESERDALTMMSAAYSINQVTSGIGALITPLTRCTVWGAAIATTIWGAIVIEGILDNAPPPGRDDPIPNVDNTGPRRNDESAAQYRSRTTWGERIRNVWDEQVEYMKGKE
jgi:hypothetical protein